MITAECHTPPKNGSHCHLQNELNETRTHPFPTNTKNQLQAALCICLTFRRKMTTNQVHSLPNLKVHDVLDKHLGQSPALCLLQFQFWHTSMASSEGMKISALQEPLLPEVWISSIRGVIHLRKTDSTNDWNQMEAVTFLDCSDWPVLQHPTLNYVSRCKCKAKQTNFCQGLADPANWMLCNKQDALKLQFCSRFVFPGK